MESTESKIATMGSDIKHLKESFDEFKEDTKQFHEKQTEMLDELKAEWQKFGGLIQGLTSLQHQVNEHEKFIAEIKAPVKEIMEERKDTKRRLRDIAWRWGGSVVLFVVVLYVLFTASSALQGVSEALKNTDTLTGN